MKTETIFVDDVTIGPRHRQLREETIDALAASMAKVGLLHPINVYSPTEAEVILVSGLHRLEAAKRLGWETIEAFLVRGDDADREMQEIAENLHRADLTVQEHADHVARWVELVEARGISGQVGQKLSVGRPESGISKAARDLPVPGDTEEAKRHNIRRAVKIASITPEAKEAARAAGIDDNQSKLLEVASQPPERQVATVLRVVKPTSDAEAFERQVAALMAAWNRASPDARKEFLSRIDTPVMDRRFGA